MCKVRIGVLSIGCVKTGPGGTRNSLPQPLPLCPLYLLWEVLCLRGAFQNCLSSFECVFSSEVHPSLRPFGNPELTTKCFGLAPPSGPAQVRASDGSTY